MPRRRDDGLPGPDDPQWYKDAIIYELHVRSFCDGDADGIGDFPGLTSRLDYLRDLGVTALWLLPFYPSPLRDDGYDIADYREVNPQYGTLRDFRIFLREAHRRGLRVITELVINHTSDQHPWFQRARRARPGSAHRDYYVWSDDPERYLETRIIFKDFEPSNWTWDPVAQAYYWHRFYHHQPDLNYDSPVVHREVLRVLEYWFKMGVDGMRLDAVPYLYEREGTNCENLPETHAFLKKLRRHVDRKLGSRMLLAEANQWPEDSAAYFGDGDECHMNFHFPIMPRLFMAVRMEDRFPIVDILEQTPEIPEGCQWALFLRNHDELTLEMVTDEERDYMYRVYAHDVTARINLGIRRRLAPLLDNNRRKIELMKSLLFALPGTPVLYYGDEIGMGDNFYLGDRNGVRTPMQWSGDRNAGFSRANPQKLFLPVVIDPEYHYESVNVEAQQTNPSSLLWWTRRLIALRKEHRAFGRGSLEWVNPENRHVLAFLRRHEQESILVVANVSRFVQAAELDLSAFQGLVPVELFGRTPFPTIGERPYFLTLGPHSFFWFALEREASRVRAATPRPRVPEEVPPPAPLLEVEGAWSGLLRGRAVHRLERLLAGHLPRQRWFAGKGRVIRAVRVREVLPVPLDGRVAQLLLVDVGYLAEDPETYVLPLLFTPGEAGEALQRHPWAVVCPLKTGDGEGMLHDAVVDPEFGATLLDVLARERSLPGERGRIEGVGDVPARQILGPKGSLPAPVPGRAEQSNTSVIFGDRWILKLFRRLEEGESLDRQVGRTLTEIGFPHTPAVAGALEYRVNRSPGSTLAVLQSFVPNQGDAWELTLDHLDRFFEHALAAPSADAGLLPTRTPMESGEEELPEAVHERVEESYLHFAWLLGRRTGELHLALASCTDPAFAPEPFSTLYQRALYQSMRTLLGQTLRTLSGARKELGEDVREPADRILASRELILSRFRRVLAGKIDGARIRVHGDYHLGQALYTGKDFVIIDFEGEPARPLSERRLKRSPLRDVAGMLRSFHYAAYSALFHQRDRGAPGHRGAESAEAWAEFWHRWVSMQFVRGYLDVACDASFLPRTAEDRQLLLDVFRLEKALYELRYELGNRPAWARIPMAGIMALLEAEETAAEPQAETGSRGA